ncbi:MAG: hypothetical protein IT562_22505 [Alphaproteobacteria bacterium]|nr:hypothetical protein [Alphaproteobacteria bacterium]
MADTTRLDHAKRRAQAVLGKARLDEDRAAAVRDWEKAAAAEAAKTARLRALRLAKEAADAEAAKAKAEAKAARPRRARTTTPSGD